MRTIHYKVVLDLTTKVCGGADLNEVEAQIATELSDFTSHSDEQGFDVEDTKVESIDVADAR